jgi:general secretion pathway protein K
VVTLIFTTAMAAAAVAFLAGRQTDALALRSQLQAVEAQAMLEAALQQTVALVVNRKPRQRVPSQLTWQFGNVAVRVRIEGESGKVDLNKADPSILQGLALAVGLPEDQAAAFADAVLDWRDENQLKLNNGAEDRDYGGEGQATSGAADRPFSHPSELRYVLPVTAAEAAMLAPYVTIYAGTEQPEPRKASAVVRRALEIARGLKRDQDQSDQMGQGDQADGTETDGSQGNGDGLGAGTGDGSGTGGFGERADRSGTGGLGGRAASGGTGGFGERSSGLSARGSGGQDGPEAGRLSPSAGQGSSLSKLEGPDERRRGADAAAGGGAAGVDDTTGAQTLFLDVRFPNGYEAAAKAVVAFSAGGAGSATAGGGVGSGGSARTGNGLDGGSAGAGGSGGINGGGINGGDDGGQAPFVVLDWTPVLGSRSGGT